MKKISVVIPMYYEEKVAEECYRRTKEVLIKIENYEHEIIFINDWSEDHTLSILKEIANNDKKVKVISFSRNFGQQSAVTAGLKYVTSDGIIGEYIIRIYDESKDRTQYIIKKINIE